MDKFEYEFVAFDPEIEPWPLGVFRHPDPHVVRRLDGEEPTLMRPVCSCRRKWKEHGWTLAEGNIDKIEPVCPGTRICRITGYQPDRTVLYYALIHGAHQCSLCGAEIAADEQRVIIIPDIGTSWQVTHIKCAQNEPRLMLGQPGVPAPTVAQWAIYSPFVAVN